MATITIPEEGTIRTTAGGQQEIFTPGGIWEPYSASLAESQLKIPIADFPLFYSSKDGGDQLAEEEGKLNEYVKPPEEERVNVYKEGEGVKTIVRSDLVGWLNSGWTTNIPEAFAGAWNEQGTEKKGAFQMTDEEKSALGMATGDTRSQEEKDLENSLVEQEKTIAKFTSDLDALRKTKEDASNALIASIKAQFAQRMSEVRDIGKRQLASLQTAGFRSGFAYQPTMFQNILSAQEQATQKELAELEVQQASAIASAQMAALSEDYELLSKQMSLITEQQDKKIATLKELASASFERNKEIMAEKTQTEIANLLSQGTDPYDLLDRYNLEDIESAITKISTIQTKQQEAMQAKIDNVMPIMYDLLTGNVEKDTNTIKKFSAQYNIPFDQLYGDLKSFQQTEYKNQLNLAKLEADVENATDPLNKTLKLLQIAKVELDLAIQQQKAEGIGNERILLGTNFVPKGDLTAEEQKKVQALDSGSRLVDQIERLYYNAVGVEYEGMGAGVWSKLQGGARTIASIAGFNQGWRIYQNFLDSNRAPIAKGMKGEVGNLTEQEQKQALKSFPSISSSPIEAKKAFENIRQQIKDNCETLGYFEEEPIITSDNGMSDDFNRFISQ